MADINYRVMVGCHNALVTAVKSEACSLADAFFENGLFSECQRDEIQSDIPPLVRARKLVGFIEEKVKYFPGSYFSIISIFRAKFEHLGNLIESLEDERTELRLRDCEVQSQLTYVSRLSEDEVHEFIRLECQCGECAIDEFVAGKDCKKSTPRSVPRLRITSRDLGQKMLNRQEMRFSDYKNSLKDKNNEIRTEYTCLLLNTMQELKTKCSLEIAKQRVRSLLTPKDSLGSQYKRMYKRELDKRLKDVQTYEELQQFLEQFCSWFNIDFIADLRKVLLGYDSQDPMVVTYKENLMRYLQRCCFQLTVCDLEGQAEHNEIICKTSTDFHEIKEEQHDIFERRLRQCIFIPVSERRIAECGEEMVFRMQEPLPPTTIKDPYVMNLWPLKYSLRVFEAYNGKFQSLLSSNHPISSIGDSDVIIVSEVLSPVTAGGCGVVEMNVVQRVQLPLFPTKCSTCGRLAIRLGEGRRIMRCGQCKAVGYCDRQCQQRDWSSHKMQCRHGRPVPVGLPFVVSLPSSSLTFSTLTTAVEALARRSVNVTRREPSGNSASDDTEAVQVYTLVPVDRYGDSKDSCPPLTDKGAEVLHIEGRFLAMDWRNNPKDSHSVIVTPKQTLDHVVDPSSATEVTPGDGDPSLQQCLELFTEPELLTKDEAWYCSSCKKHREATKQMSVWRLPQVLILHLKRFKFRNMRWKDKIDQLVSFPLSGLDMSPYMLGDAGRMASTEAPPTYDLYAIVNHYGVVHIGHYTAMVKPPCSEGNDWLRYDDECVYPIAKNKVETKEAYILFYVQREK